MRNVFEFYGNKFVDLNELSDIHKLLQSENRNMVKVRYKRTGEEQDFTLPIIKTLNDDQVFANLIQQWIGK